MNAAPASLIPPSSNPVAVESAGRSGANAPAADSFEALLGRTQTRPAFSRPNLLEKGQIFARRAVTKLGEGANSLRPAKQPKAYHAVGKSGRALQEDIESAQARSAQTKKPAEPAQPAFAGETAPARDDAAEELSAQTHEEHEGERLSRNQQLEDLSALAQAALFTNGGLLLAPSPEEETLSNPNPSGSRVDSDGGKEVIGAAETAIAPENDELSNAQTPVEFPSTEPVKSGASLKLKEGGESKLAFDAEARFGKAAHADKISEALQAEAQTEISAESGASAKMQETIQSGPQRVSPVTSGTTTLDNPGTGEAAELSKTIEMAAAVTEPQSLAGQQSQGGPRDFSSDTSRLLAADLAVQRGFSVPPGASALAASEWAPRAGLISKVAEDMWAAVSEFKVKGGDHVEVQLRPDEQTRLHIEIRHAQGEMEVRARLEGGDPFALASGWNDLRDSLATRGVTLRQLESEWPPHQQSGQPQAQAGFDAETRREAFAQARHRRLLEEVAAPVRAARPPSSQPVASVKATRAEPMRWGAERGWEGWA
jgi:hypothetical protein